MDGITEETVGALKEMTRAVKRGGTVPNTSQPHAVARRSVPDLRFSGTEICTVLTLYRNLLQSIMKETCEEVVRESSVTRRFYPDVPRGADGSRITNNENSGLVADHKGYSGGSFHTGERWQNKNGILLCWHCQASVAAGRYAQHLERCLGNGGRQSSRAASARLKNTTIQPSAGAREAARETVRVDGVEPANETPVKSEPPPSSPMIDREDQWIDSESPSPKSSSKGTPPRRSRRKRRR